MTSARFWSTFFVYALTLPILASAQEGATDRSAPPKNRAPIDATNAVRISYGFPAWNKSPVKIDSASILMREGSTGRIVQIHLEEDAPDSSLFSGIFSINWRNVDKLQTEFYIPPQDLMSSNEGLKKVAEMITKNQLKRKPFLLRRGNANDQTVEIFDSVEQAQNALKAYRAESQLRATFGLKTKNYPSDQEIDISKLAQTSEDRLEAARAATERIRLHQLETNRLREQLAKFIALKAPERAAQKDRAAKVAAEGLAAFREDLFEEAAKKFQEAIQLAPDTFAYIYQYAVTLYRLEQYNRSLVFLQISDDASINQNERQYYLGLNYLGLRDFDNAEASFERVVVARDPAMSDSAKFYIGVVNFEMQNWEKAQAAFQKVLDTSTNKDLDKQAEAYIEQILRQRQFDVERAKKWTLSATIGEMVDSNVILSSISALDQGTASDSLGYRSLLMGSLNYRPIYEEEREFAVQADLLTIYTVDKSFARAQSLRNADPTVATLTVPWSFKSTAFGFGYKLDLAPGYETIIMSLEDDQSKVIIDSILLNVNNLVVMSPTWFANWNVETRKDTTHLAASTGDNDANAYKVKLLNSNTFILNPSKTKFLMAEAGATMNQAIGRDATYNRLDLSVGYLQPFYWDTVGSLKLGYFYLTYPNHTSSRVDNNVTATFGASKRLNEIYSTGLTASYNMNSSTVDLNAYKKWTLLLTMSAVTGF